MTQDIQVCPNCMYHISADKHITSYDRLYYLCETCKLIYLDRTFFPTPEQEKKRYESHQNNIEDTKYVQFLYKLLDPMLEFLNATMIGLDYGCGPNPVLSQLLHKHGITCRIFDPYFFPNKPLGLNDFIILTETIEHFYTPAKEFYEIFTSLKPNGYLGIMTDTWHDIKSFPSWYYVRDYTHVAFYHLETLHYISQKYNAELVYTDQKRVFIFKKKHDLS